MARIGTYLIMGGAISGVLSLFNYEVSLLMWIDLWGDGFAWLIRGALILTGMALISHETKTQQAQHQPHPQGDPVQQGPIS